MLFWTEKYPHLESGVVSSVVTLKSGRFSRPGLHIVNPIRETMLQLKPRPLSLIEILQTLSEQNPRFGSDYKTDYTSLAGLEGGELCHTEARWVTPRRL